MSKEEKIINTIKEEAVRVQYGKILLEVSVWAGEIKNVQFETKRSVDFKNVV